MSRSATSTRFLKLPWNKDKCQGAQTGSRSVSLYVP